MFAAVLAMPVLAVPAILRGGVSRDLLEAAAVGVAVFVALFAVGAVLIAYDGVLAWVGRVIQNVRNRIRRHAEPLRTLPERLLRERDRIVGTLGPRWKRALAATSGRWAFDYATLLAALAAVGSQPRPSLVLLAFCAAQVLAQIPITPGGLGFVEAGLTAMLALAGVSGGRRGARHVRLPAVRILAAAAGRASAPSRGTPAAIARRDRHLIGQLPDCEYRRVEVTQQSRTSRRRQPAEGSVAGGGCDGDQVSSAPARVTDQMTQTSRPITTSDQIG